MTVSLANRGSNSSTAKNTNLEAGPILARSSHAGGRPTAFWLFSIGGGVLLFAYSLYRRDPVFIAGQGLGLFIYLRNLYFVQREKKQATA